MAEKLPLVYVDGQLSQLPTGDAVDGAELGSLTAGSGLVGGGDLQTGNKRLDVALASSASGVIFVGDSIGMDGADLVTASSALASGVAGSSASAIALASGVAAQSDANTALASGNAALDLAVNFSSSSSVDFTASSVIQAGNPVGLDDAGKARVVITLQDSTQRSFGTPVTFDSGTIPFGRSVYDPSNNKVVIVYRDQSNSSYATAIVGTVSGTSISFGTKVVVESSWSTPYGVTYDSTNNKVVFCFSRDVGGLNYGAAIVGTISGTTSSWGSSTDFNSHTTADANITYDSSNQRVVIVYEDRNNSDYGTAIVGTVSGTSISFGSPVVFSTSDTNNLYAGFDSTNNKVVVAYRDVGNSNYGTAIVGTVSGTSISFGTAVVFEANYATDMPVVYDSSNQRIVIAYYGYTGSATSRAIVGTVSGTSITFGTAVEFLANRASYIATAYDSTLNQVIIAYRDQSNSAYGSAIVGTVSDTTIGFGTSVLFDSNVVLDIGCVYDSSNQRVVINYTDDTNSSDGKATVGSVGSSTFPTLNSANNFIGTSQSTVASGEPVTINVPRSIGYNNTGLSTGYFYYVDPTTSGYTTASGEPSTWNGDPSFPWRPIAKAVSSSGLLILETI
tara:strand:+ start:515 stop:2368 length:1854 start_codon:yes stop_codon:yes gene_type:complete